ncbi:Hypothetical predicted protein [Mytilus galloprovincialis]|uniref:Uncharacterized protein n=1 Tax=Mytilus galloprovincialis TaxID=29158 RepID=A0A8B6G1R3_MYTGA|nr:Hypothetical predicted protein [Mytilus galloprovincialis]
MCYSNRTTTLNDYEVCSAYANETVNEQNGSFEFTDTTADADADAEADAPPDADDEDDADAPVPNDTSADALAVDVFDDFADALADVAAEAFADTVSNSKHDFSNKQRSTVLLKCMCVHLSNSVLHCNAQLSLVSRKYVVTFLQYISCSSPGI